MIDSVFALTPYRNGGDAVRHQVSEYLIQQCMRKAGFEYDQVPFVERAEVSDALGLAPPLPSEDDIGVLGYRAFDDRQVAAVPNSPADVAQAKNDSRAQGKAWQEALVGPAEKNAGCAGQALDRIRAEVGLRAPEEWKALVATLAPQLNPYARSDASALDKAKGDWRSCMKAFGHSAPGPLELQTQAVISSDGSSPPSPSEIALALDDLKCRKASNFRGVYLSTIADGVRLWRKANEGAIAELQTTTSREVEALRAMAGQLGLR